MIYSDCGNYKLVMKGMVVKKKKMSRRELFFKKHDKCNISFVDLRKIYQRAEVCPVCKEWF